MAASLERIRHDIETIARCSSSGPGTNRLTFTPEYAAAVDYVTGEMEALGYERRTTVHGNALFRRRGSDWTQPAVAVGSHLDAVPRGGRFDGVAGVIAGVEVARLLGDADLKRPFEVIVFAEEEGARFGSVLAGSKAFVGRLSMRELAGMRDKDGTSYLEALKEWRRHSRPVADETEGAQSLAAYFELHIEQSIVLESARIPIGIVQAIVGIRQYRVTYTGVANHAGATPMGLRNDSLAAAALAIAAVEESAVNSRSGVTVGTVGMIVNEPNAANVIPARTTFSIDIRDTDATVIQETDERVLARVRGIAEDRGVDAEVTLTAESAPVCLSERLRSALVRSAVAEEIDYLEMPSGAAHDAQEVARITDAAMVFVPSLAGRSHCPEESTPYESITRGVDLLAAAILETTAEWP